MMLTARKSIAINNEKEIDSGRETKNPSLNLRLKDNVTNSNVIEIVISISRMNRKESLKLHPGRLGGLTPSQSDRTRRIEEMIQLMKLQSSSEKLAVGFLMKPRVTSID
jgi:hypothetical protein